MILFICIAFVLSPPLMEPSIPKIASYIIFGALVLALVVGYIYSPTFRDGVRSFFSSISTKQVETEPLPEPEVPQTFTASTWDLPKNGTASTTYSFSYYPKRTIAQQMSNEVVAVGTPDSSQVMLVRVLYRPKATTPSLAWPELYKAYYRTSSVPEGVKPLETPAAFPHGSTWAAYSDGTKQWVVAQFPESPEWFFVFDITTAINQDLVPSVESFAIIP